MHLWRSCLQPLMEETDDMKKKKEMRENSSQDMVNVGYGESETTALHQRTDCLRAFALTAGDSADGAGRPAATVLPRGTPRALWALGDNAAGGTQQQT